VERLAVFWRLLRGKISGLVDDKIDCRLIIYTVLTICASHLIVEEAACSIYSKKTELGVRRSKETWFGKIAMYFQTGALSGMRSGQNWKSCLSRPMSV
jgi:hypothetical protein